MSASQDTLHEGCPVLAGFDPLAPEQVRDPFPLLAQARRELPVFYMPGFDRWCVTRYEDLEQVLSDPECFSSAEFIDFPPFPEEVASQLTEGHPLEQTLVTQDPPAHTRMRRLAVKAFTPRQATARAAEVREIADALIDGFIDDREADLVKAYTSKLPIRVIGPVLGISSDEATALYKWAMEALILVGSADQFSPEKLLELSRGQVDFDRAIRAIVADRRRNLRGADDLVSSLIAAEDDEGAPALADQEIVGIVSAAIVAGSDTSASTLAHTLRYLLENRAAWEEILANPALIPNAIEETLRLNGPSRVVTRTTTREVTLGGVTIPKGAKLYVHIGSGSRDEAVFENPDAFQLHRANQRRHLAFGKGIHFCIGAPLARTQIRVGIEAIAERIPSLRLVPGHEIEYLASILVAPVAGGLVVEWD
jgi:cytochrome P450